MSSSPPTSRTQRRKERHHKLFWTRSCSPFASAFLSLSLCILSHLPPPSATLRHLCSPRASLQIPTLPYPSFPRSPSALPMQKGGGEPPAKMAGDNWLKRQLSGRSGVATGTNGPFKNREGNLDDRMLAPRAKLRIPTPDSSTRFKSLLQCSPTRAKGARALQRVSSLLSLPNGRGGDRSASPSPSPSLPDGDKPAKYKTRHLDWEDWEESEGSQVPYNNLDTWHNPTLLQQIETLQTAMMSKRDLTAPIPIV